MSVDDNVFFREALRESEERHRVTLQMAMDGFLRADMQGRILEINEMYCRMSGYSEQELVAMNIADIEAVHTAEMIAANIRSFAELGPKRFESLHRRKDGSLFDVEISAQYQPIGSGQTLVFVRDITERKRAEEALRRSESYLAEGQRLSHTGSWAWNPLTEQCFYWSEEMFRIFEIDPQGGLPTNEVFWSRIHPEDRESMRELLWKSAIEKTEYVHDHRIVLPDGAVKHIHAIGHPVLDKAGELVEYVGTIVDATDRKRTEQALRQSEAYLAEAERLSHTGSWAFDVVGDKYIYVSEECSRIFELDVQESLPTREAVSRLIHPEDWDRVNASFEKLLREKVDTSSEFRIAVPSGTTKHVLAIRHPVLNSAGDVASIVGTVIDMTERKRAEEALRRSEAYLVEGQRLSHTGSWSWSPATRQPLYWSEEMFRIFGLNPQEGVPTTETFLQRIHSEDLDRTYELFEKAALGDMEYEQEHRIVLPDGTIKHIHAIGHPVLDENGLVAEYVGTVMDVTDRKRAEEAVRLAGVYLSNIIDSMPSILVGMDNARTVTQWNRQAEVFTGIPAGEAIGKPIVHLLPDFAPWITTMGTDMDEYRPSSLEKLLIEKKGERRFYDLMLYPLLVDSVEGAVLRIEDVTERARIQELMVQTEKMMSIGGLAAGMAHEINNPLGIITQAAQNIERRISLELPANRKVSEELGLNLEGIRAYFDKRQISDAIASIRTASSRAAKIVTNMLQFSRSADTTMEFTSLAHIVDEALELAGSDYDLKKNYDFRSIEIIKDYQDVPRVPIVSVEIEQVILNLLKNAAQAITAPPPDRKPRIILRLRREDRYAVIEVEDNGPGMAEDIRRRVFEPFFTTKAPSAGTGLGLSVSYMIVTQNHKGLMEVQSTPGRGTVFKVRLPMGSEQT